MNNNDTDPSTVSAAHLDRRRFFQRAGLAWAGAAVASQWLGARDAGARDREGADGPAKADEKALEEIPYLEEKPHESGIPRRRFGKGDDWVSMMGVGGFSIGAEAVSEGEGIAVVQEAIDNGVNFMENAWEYNKHMSEERMGKALAARPRLHRTRLVNWGVIFTRQAQKVARKITRSRLKTQAQR